MLNKIKVEGLFNRFNYEIDLKKEGITILTGPNGYGKTTILKIIYAFSVKNLFFFFQLPFDKIFLTQDEKEISLLKIDEDTIETKIDNKSFRHKKSEVIKDIRRFIERSPYRQIDETQWINSRTGDYYTAESIANLLLESDHLIQERYLKFKKQLPDFIDVYLIREQRLIRKAQVNRRRDSPYYYEDETRESFSNTIEAYALELSKELKDILANSSKIGQELDSSFPRRLFDETEHVSGKEFDRRYNIIKEKQGSLSKYGLSATKEDSQTSFREENAKALLVYLNDTEKNLKYLTKY
ncbi:AAA family ATPase [Candidatus Electronema sp. TJ]|uniref:AAA family ATPase n=1 Tax=Candidatus Electronema sp. TJ TaxID=3401573 RepID=UPI003AA8EABC